jgi:hypothetical protein
LKDSRIREFKGSRERAEDEGRKVRRQEGMKGRCQRIKGGEQEIGKRIEERGEGKIGSKLNAESLPAFGGAEGDQGSKK